MKQIDFNSHTPHGVRLYLNIAKHNETAISTHTPHTGCDNRSLKRSRYTEDFNSHTPHGVRRVDFSHSDCCTGFQLTHPTRGATKERWVRLGLRTLFQLTHPTRGATLSIARSHFWGLKFQLTHPTRGATSQALEAEKAANNFNSHTPHGVRPHLCPTKRRQVHFNSHTPHGVRLIYV